MLIATTNEVAGHETEEVFGEVFGLTVRSRKRVLAVRCRPEVGGRRRAEGDDEGARG